MKQCQLRVLEDSSVFMCAHKKRMVQSSECGNCEVAYAIEVFDSAEAGYSPAPSSPPPVSFLGKVWNLADAMVDFAVSGFELASKEERARRMGECDLCKKRIDCTCTVCGCIIPLKVLASAWKCPDKKW